MESRLEKIINSLSDPEIDDVGIIGGQDGTLKVEMRKLYFGDDPFLNIPKKALDKNSKRRINRAEKLEKMVGLGYAGTGGAGTEQGIIEIDKTMWAKGGAKPKSLTPEQVYNGYFLWHLATPPYNLEYLTELSTANAVHWACIRAKATNIVGLGHKWEDTYKTKDLKQLAAEGDDDGKRMKKLAKKLGTSTDTLEELLEDFNKIEAFQDTLLKIWMDVESTGSGYMEIGRNRDKTLGYVGHVPSYNMRVRVDRDGFVQMLPSQMDKLVFFRNFGDTKTPDLFGKDPNPNEIIHFKKEHFKNAYYGIPDIISALPAIAGDKFAAEYNLEYFENKAVPRYALIVKGARLSSTAERKILEYFRKEVKGKHHGTLYIPVPAAAGTNVDVKLEPIENQPQEYSFGGYREANRLEIMLAHRVPGSQIGVELSNLSQSRESSQVFKDQVCRPEQARIEWKINLIIKQFTDLFKFRFEELNLLDEETKNRIMDRNIRNGHTNANEGRSDLGLQPRAGGEEYMDIRYKPMTNPEDASLQAGMDATGMQGPPRITTDGSPKNNSPMTPANQSAAGPQSKLAAQDKSGEAPPRIT